jgi:simple sugar transport system permease protein
LSDAPWTAFLEAAVRLATPLAFAAIGELVAERAGVINIGVEGAIIAGAFGALVCANQWGVASGFAGGAAAGIAIALVFAVFVVRLRSDQIIAGTAITMLGLGLTGALYRTIYGSAGVALTTPTLGAVAVPIVHRIPLLGAALFNQPLSTYVLYALVPALSWWMYRTTGGLALRAVGENPAAAAACGVSPQRVRLWAILWGGAMGGLSGATLVLAQVGTFAEGMSAGRGFIAIAIVVLGRWTPLGVIGGALLFGSASALQYVTQTFGWPLPYQASLALPYVVTLAALAGVRGPVAAPAALGTRQH